MWRSRAVAAARLLVGCIVALGVAAPSAAATISRPTLTLTTAALGASGVDYRVFFTATSGLATANGAFSTSNGSVTINAPLGTSFAATTASVIDLHANMRIERCCATLSNSAKTLTIPVGAAPPGEKLEVWLKNVTNPPSAVPHPQLVVSTTADPVPVSSAIYTLVAAHGVSTPTPALTTAAAGATGVDYRVAFITSTTGALNGNGGWVTVDGPKGDTSFLGASAVVTDAFTGRNVAVCCTTLSGGNATIKIPVAGPAAGDPLTIWLKNVTNPSAAAAIQHMTVHTSADPVPVLSAAYSIVAAHHVSAPTLALTTAAAAAKGVDYRLGFITSGTGALNGTGGSITVVGIKSTLFTSASVVVTDAFTGQNVAVCCTTLSNNDATIKIPVAGPAAGDQLTVWLKNVTNPLGAAANQHMIVTTSADRAPALSAAYSIVAAHGVSTPAVLLSKTAPNTAGVKYSVTFSASSTGALSGTGGSITILAPAGTSFAGSSGAMVIDESADDVNLASCCATLSDSNATIKIPVAGGAALDRLQVILPNVTNPETPGAGSRRLTVTTSADHVAALSGLY